MENDAAMIDKNIPVDHQSSDPLSFNNNVQLLIDLFRTQIETSAKKLALVQTKMKTLSTKMSTLESEIKSENYPAHIRVKTEKLKISRRHHPYHMKQFALEHLATSRVKYDKLKIENDEIFNDLKEFISTAINNSTDEHSEQKVYALVDENWDTIVRKVEELCLREKIIVNIRDMEASEQKKKKQARMAQLKVSRKKL